MVSLALSQSEILHKDVFLVEKIDSRSQELMTHLKAVCFLRPTAENVQRLKKHLAAPRFSEYHLCGLCHIVPWLVQSLLS